MCVCVKSRTLQISNFLFSSTLMVIFISSDEKKSIRSYATNIVICCYTCVVSSYIYIIVVLHQNFVMSTSRLVCVSTMLGVSP